jgi:hypothetical protein
MMGNSEDKEKETALHGVTTTPEAPPQTDFAGKLIDFAKIRNNGEMTRQIPQQGSVLHRWMNPIETKQYREGWRLGHWPKLNDARKMAYARWLAKELGIVCLVELCDDIVNAEASGENMELQHLQSETLGRSSWGMDPSKQKNDRPQPGGSPLGDQR